MGYELPRAVQVRLLTAARGLRNADAVMRLATFLARWHTGPRVIGRPFTVDRIALAGVEALGLSASQIRGALAALDRIGLLERHVMPGSPYRRTEHGLRRKPVLWRVCADFLAMFEKANAAATAKRLSAARRAVPQPEPLLAKKEGFRRALLSGDQPQSPLEAKLAELGQGVFEAEERRCLVRSDQRSTGRNTAQE
jgi:hypothetical protein